MDSGGGGPPPSQFQFEQQRRRRREVDVAVEAIMDPDDYVRRDVYEAERQAASADMRNVLITMTKVTGAVERLENEFHHYQLENRDRESRTAGQISSQRTSLDERLLQWLVLIIIAVITILGPHLNFH